MPTITSALVCCIGAGRTASCRSDPRSPSPATCPPPLHGSSLLSISPLVEREGRDNVTDDCGNMDTACATCNSVWSMTDSCIGSELGTATPERPQRPLPPRFPPLQLRARAHGIGRRPRASLGPHHEARRCCQGAISVSLVALHRPSCRTPPPFFSHVHAARCV